MKPKAAGRKLGAQFVCFHFKKLKSQNPKIRNFEATSQSHIFIIEGRISVS